MKCDYCDYKTKKKDTMCFHLLIGHPDIKEEFLRENTSSNLR